MTDLVNVSAPTAVLDDAHVGDIRGALGTIRRDHVAGRSWRSKVLALLAIMGPGLIVMVGDNDAGGVAIYTQAGQNYGTSLLWTLLLLIPVLIVNQEMVVRLGLVTGVGHARLIMERFGKFWGAFSVGDLFVLNFLTLITEFIGISLAMSYFGVSPFISVPISALLLVVVTATGKFSRWEQLMFLFIAVSLVSWPMVFMVHVDAGRALRDSFVPGVQGGLTSNALLLIIGIVGTTVAPWQLFFQQSNVIDKRLTPRWMKYELLDTVFGAGVLSVAAAVLIIGPAVGLQGTPLAGKFVDAGQVADGLARYVSPMMGNVMAVLLLDAAILGAAAVTLSTSYAFGDVFGVKHSLHRSWKDAKQFYTIYSGLVLLAAGVVLIPNAPLGLITLAVQVLAGILLPSATVFLLMLCNDKAVLGPWVNRPWLNAVASLIVGVLVVLSLILAVTTVFPGVDPGLLSTSLFAGLAVLLVAIGAVVLTRRRPALVAEDLLDASQWRMPPLAELTKPVQSLARSAGLTILWVYLAIAVGLSVLKVVQLALAS